MVIRLIKGKGFENLEKISCLWMLFLDVKILENDLKW